MIPKFRAWFPAPCGVNRLFYKKYGTYRYTCSWSISGPSRGGQVLIQTGKSIAHYIQNNKGFPSPSEVDRFLYPIGYVPYKIVSRGFRPLARWIGSYTSTGDFLTGKRVMFPSPREVDRFLYSNIHHLPTSCILVSVPSRGGQVLIPTHP